MQQSVPDQPRTGTPPPVPQEDTLDHEILRAIRRMIRAVDLYSRSLVVRDGITVPQLLCLMALNADGSLSTGALAKKVHLTPSTVTGILDRLEKRKYVQRARDERDRRVVRVRIKEPGRAVVQVAPNPIQSKLVQGLRALRVQEKGEILHSLTRLLELMEVREDEAAPILEVGPLDQPVREVDAEAEKPA